MRILLLGEDRTEASPVIRNLRQAGHRVEALDRPALLRESVQQGGFSVAIVDFGIASHGRLELISRLRRVCGALAILVLSDPVPVADRVRALDLGADDFLTRPYEEAELLGRLRALERRAGRTHSAHFALADLRIDPQRREVFRGGKRIRLQPREFALLGYLANNADRIVSTDEIIEHVWRYDFDPKTNVVASRMCRLREKVDVGFESRLIHTIKGRGYVLCVRQP